MATTIVEMMQDLINEGWDRKDALEEAKSLHRRRAKNMAESSLEFAKIDIQKGRLTNGYRA
jgi:hypothetical protein